MFSTGCAKGTDVGRGASGRRIGRARDLALWGLAAPLLLGIVAGPAAAQEAGDPDRTVAEAGREGRALLRELQHRRDDRRTAGESALAPSDPVLREAARMRAEIRRRRTTRRTRSGPDRQDGLQPIAGICRGCGA